MRQKHRTKSRRPRRSGDIRRCTREQNSSEENVRIILEGLRNVMSTQHGQTLQNETVFSGPYHLKTDRMRRGLAAAASAFVLVKIHARIVLVWFGAIARW